MRLAVFLAAGSLLCASAALAQSDTTEPPPSPQQVEAGDQLFNSICSACHGKHMVNPGNGSFDLRKFPHADHARFLNSVENGKKSMPPWKDVLHPEEIEEIWAYVRTGGVSPR